MADLKGWHPDPGGARGRFRYWDGSRWSAETTADPTAPPPGPPPAPRRRSRGVLVGAVIAGLVVLALATVYARFAANPHVAGALRGMAAVTAGMIAATGIKLAASLHRHPLPLPLTASVAVLAIVGLAFLRLPMLLVLAVLGSLGSKAAGSGDSTCWVSQARGSSGSVSVPRRPRPKRIIACAVRWSMRDG